MSGSAGVDGTCGAPWRRRRRMERRSLPARRPLQDAGRATTDGRRPPAVLLAWTPRGKRGRRPHARWTVDGGTAGGSGRIGGGSPTRRASAGRPRRDSRGAIAARLSIILWVMSRGRGQGGGQSPADEAAVGTAVTDVTADEATGARGGERGGGKTARPLQGHVSGRKNFASADKATEPPCRKSLRTRPWLRGRREGSGGGGDAHADRGKTA